jgi:predicted metal-dependent RNase
LLEEIYELLKQREEETERVIKQTTEVEMKSLRVKEQEIKLTALESAIEVGSRFDSSFGRQACSCYQLNACMPANSSLSHTF